MSISEDVSRQVLFRDSFIDRRLDIVSSLDSGSPTLFAHKNMRRIAYFAALRRTSNYRQTSWRVTGQSEPNLKPS